MKVAVDAALASPKNRGTGSYVTNLIKALCRIGQDDVIALLPDWSVQEADLPVDDPALTVVRVDCAAEPPDDVFARRAHWEQELLPSRLGSLGADVFFGPAFAMPLRWDGPAVVTVHDLAFERRGQWNTLASDDYHLAWAKPSAARAGALLAVSEFTAMEIRTLWNLRDKRVFVSPLAPSLPFLPDDRALSRALIQKAYAIEPDYILCVGDSVGRKNVPRLLQAFALLGAEDGFRSTELVLLTRSAASMEQTAQELGIWGRTRFIEDCPEHMKPHLYAAAAVSVYPSLFEGFGLPPLEAMACGTAVAVSNLDVLGEVVGDAAVTFEPTNVSEIAHALRTLLTDGDLREDLQRAGRARARSFSWNRTAEVTREALRYAIG
jgi:glycosyltransferase involved in cell wall biosynthesis